MKQIRIVALVGATALILAACSSSSGGVTVDDAWGRTSPAAAANGAFYMNIAGGDTDDVLVSVTTDACGMVELHETVMSDGTMSMQHLPAGIAVPAGSEVVLEPGGLHVMCMNKQADFNTGDSVELDLVFEAGDTISVTAEIRVE